MGELEGTEPGRPFTFIVDARDAGWGQVKTDIVWEQRSLHHTLTEIEKDMYRVTVSPPEYGKYRVYIYFNGVEVKGQLVPGLKSCFFQKSGR